MTEKESIVKAIRHRDQLFQPTMTLADLSHGRSSYSASHRRFQALQASVQQAGVLLKRILQEPYHSRPFVVMLRRSLCCFS
jgi:hypothetical protein